MFSFLSSFQKKVLTAFFVFGFLAAGLTGCDSSIADNDANNQGTLPENLQGEWVFIPPGSNTPADYYNISESTLRYVMDDPDYGSDYAAAIRFVSNYSNDSGVIIIEYTQGYIFGADYDVEYPFTGIYYKNLGGNTVQLANAYDGSGRTETTTLDEAKAKFTRNKMDTYVSWTYVQPYTKNTQ